VGINKRRLYLVFLVILILTEKNLHLKKQMQIFIFINSKKKN